jgi:3-oxosteroid 1-dehydrogenase
MTDAAQTDWDVETDLLVIGSGAAGMTTAIVAATEGLETMVLEKTEYYGGTTALSGGVAWIPNNPLMKAEGIPDTPEDALTYLRHNVGNRVADAKLKAFVDTAPKMVDYMLANSALSFNLTHGFPDYRPETPGGCKGGRSIDPKVFSARKLKDSDRLRPPIHGVPGGIVGSVTELRRLAFFKSNPAGLLKVWTVLPRNLWNKIANRKHLATGQALIARLRYTMQEKNIPLWLNSPLEELIVEDDAVVGVRTTRDGKPAYIRARKGVMMAAGGFERNPAMRRQFFGDKATEAWVDGTYSSGSAGNTGDTIRAGESIGAALDLMDDMWWMPSTKQEGKPPFIIVFERGLPHIMVVNARGERFANEARPYNELGRVIFEDNAPPAFLVFDHEYRQKFALANLLPGVTPEKLVKEGYIKRADTLEDLAAQAGIDPAGLARTVARFNQMAEAGKDEDFNKGESAFDRYAGDPSHQPNPCLGPIAKAPFYAMELHPGDLGSKGGLLTDEHGRVLRDDGTAVPGLYAAGNNSACVMGNFYAGAGGTIGPAMTYGYLAAMHAAGK